MSLLSTVFYIDDCIKYVLCNRFPCKELTEIKDIVYDEDMPETGKLDIIYDENQRGKLTPGKFPVFLMIHGGGWITSDKKMRRSYCQHMARTGALTRNINYWLGPKYQFPDYMKQVYKALQWIVNNAVKYGLDLDNLVISGDSAGGHLSVATINCQARPEYREKLGLPDVPEIKIKGAILNCPAIDFEGKIINLPIIRTKTYHCTGIKNYKKLKSEYPYYEQLQVFNGVTPDFPRLFLNNGIQDVFTNCGSKKLRKALEENGVKYEYFCSYEPLNSFHDYNLKLWMPAARIVLKKEKDFLWRVYENK